MVTAPAALLVLRPIAGRNADLAAARLARLAPAPAIAEGRDPAAALADRGAAPGGAKGAAKEAATGNTGSAPAAHVRMAAPGSRATTVRAAISSPVATGHRDRALRDRALRATVNASMGRGPKLPAPKLPAPTGRKAISSHAGTARKATGLA